MTLITIQETGEVIECPDIEMRMPVPTVDVDGKPVQAHIAISLLMALTDYWRARAIRFETELADIRQKERQT